MKKAQGPGAGLETSETIGAKLDALEAKMDRLRALYESYFLGLDKRPPEVPRTELQRLMLDMQKTAIRNAALRFRYQTLQQRWTSHINHWNRTLREMENGTYRRDVERTQRRIAQRGETLSAQEAIALGIPAARAQAFVDRHNQQAEKQQRLSAPRAQNPAAPQRPSQDASPTAPPISDEEIGALRARWRLANQKLGQADTTPAASKLREQLEAQIPRVLRERGGQKVHFDVATKDGKVVIRVKKVE